MAINALGMGKRIRHFGFMAGLAVYLYVHPFQFVACEVMIECLQVFDPLKSLLGMARFAISTKSCLVNIIMTTHTVAYIAIDIILEHVTGIGVRVMTFGTSCCFVLAQQGKFGFVVIEILHAPKRVERFLYMAFLAIGTEPTIMGIVVTA